MFILLFFNLGVKFPPKQSWLQWGQTRCQKLVGSLGSLQSQTPQGSPQPFSHAAGQAPALGTPLQKKVQPLPHC